MVRARCLAPLFALLAVLFLAPSAQANIFDDVIGGIGDVIDGVEDVVDPVVDPICDVTPWLPVCIVDGIIDPGPGDAFCLINPAACEVIEPGPGPIEPFYRYYSTETGIAKTKVKDVGYDKGEYAWMVQYDGEAFEATDSYGYTYTGSAFAIGTKGGKYQLSLDDESLATFGEYLSQRATAAYGAPVNVVLTELPIIKIKQLEGGTAKLKIKARGQTASPEGVHATKYKCKMLGDNIDRFAPIPLPGPVTLEEL